MTSLLKEKVGLAYLTRIGVVMAVLVAIMLIGACSSKEAQAEERATPTQQLRSPFKAYTVYFSRRQNFSVIVVKTYPGTSWVEGWTDRRPGRYGKINLNTLDYLQPYPIEGPYYPDGFWPRLKKGLAALRNEDPEAMADAFQMNDRDKETLREKGAHGSVLMRARGSFRHVLRPGASVYIGRTDKIT